MKIVKYLCAIITIAFLSAGCQKPQDATAAVTDAVSGNYKGNLELSVMGSSQGSVQTEVHVSAVDGNTAKVILKGNPDAEGAMAIKGDIAVESVPVSENSGVYVLTESDINTMVGSTKYKGKVSGKVQGNDIELTFSLIPGAMPMPVTAVFTGKK